MIKAETAISSAFKIEISDDLNAILPDWHRLEEEGQLTPFQTRAWLIPFYQKLAPRLKAVPFFIIVRDGLGQPVMLFPLCKRKLFGFTLVEFADLGVSDYNAPLLSKTYDISASEWRELWPRILRHIKGCSLLRFKKMPHFIEGSRNPLVHFSEKTSAMDVACWGFKLPQSISDYTSFMLTKSFAKELAKKKRRIAKEGEIRYADVEAHERLNLFDVLMRQRQARCDELGRSNSLAKTPYQHFYQSVISDPDQTLVDLDAMTINDEVVATLFALNHRGALHVIMSTFDGNKWKSLSLGNLLMLYAVERSVARGMNFFDLTIGDESYKQNFGAVPSPLFSTLQPLSPVGFAAAWALTAATTLRRSWRRLVSHSTTLRSARIAANESAE